MTSARAEAMNIKSFELPLMLSFVLGATACSSSSDDGTSHLGPSKGPVANNATEAWPDAPSNVPAISADDILQACSLAGACSDEVMQLDLETRMGLIDLCVFDATFSVERAIPMSGFVTSNERTEYWVKCVLDNAQTCGLVNTCRTERDPSISCQEDGCSGPSSAAVTCNGDVATIVAGGKTLTRDCSRSFAQCDSKSATGCTDRPFTQCPANGSSADRCDGNIRLGCDAYNQVSFHDCTRLGGTCGAEADGSQGCVYPGEIAPECSGDPVAKATCSGSTLTACVNGRRLSVDSPLCTGS
jgi:hypothetical protein